MLRDNETKQHAPRDPKNALLGVELNVVCSECHKGLLKVGYDLVSPFGLDYNVIHVGLNGSPMRSLKHLSIQCWYIDLAFFRPNGIVT